MALPATSAKQDPNISAPRRQGASTRYLFMDVLRVLSFFVILIYHFFKDLAVRGIADITDPDFILSIGDVHVVKVAVGMFFLISGAGLGLKYHRLEMKAGGAADGSDGAGSPASHAVSGTAAGTGAAERPAFWDMKTLGSYYLGRFTQILIPYYIVDLIYALIKLRQTGGAIFYNVPAWRIVFTLLGVDNYMLLLSFRSFALSVGEWFLAVLIIMYILFPLIYTCLRRYPRASMILWIIYFIAIACTSDALRTFLPDKMQMRLAPIQWHMDFFIKICEFVLGVFLGIYLEKVKKYPQLAAVGLIIFGPVHPALKNTALVLALFLLGVQAEMRLKGSHETPGQASPIQGACTSLISLIAGLSYYIYLVHHIIIYSVDDHLAGRVILGSGQMLALFLAEIAVMVITAMLLRKVSRCIRSCLPAPLS